jgi:hypothetical protein
VVIVESQAVLLEVVAAAAASGRLTRRLNGGQEQADEGPDDRDDHQEFDERERPTNRSHYL